MEPQITTPKKNFPPYFLAGIILLIIILGGVLLKFKGLNFISSKIDNSGSHLSSNTLSPNILYITAPVTTINGEITAINGNVISLKIQEVNTTLSSPNPQNNIIYEVTVSPKTAITQTNSDGTIKDLTQASLREGESVQVSSSQDLRTLEGSSFEAASVVVPPIRTSFSGYVSAINGNVLSVKAELPPQVSAQSNTPLVPVQKDYQVSTNSSTDILLSTVTSSPSAQPVTRKASISEISVHSPVTIYTDTDIDSTNQVTATKITGFLGPQPK